MKAKTTNKIKVKDTAEDAVLVLRTCNADGSSYGGFMWPLEVGAIATAPDWNPSSECGGGLHGWMWGCGDWSLKAQSSEIRWIVLEVAKSSIVDLGGKVKFPTCKIVSIHADWAGAMAVIRRIGGLKFEASATGRYGHASATGDAGHASATGHAGHASATGRYGHASATGYDGHASAGQNGRSRSAEGGIISILWHDGKRPRIAVGYIGEDGIKPNTWYEVVNGKLTEVPS